jgi:hypothetical protein
MHWFSSALLVMIAGAGVIGASCAVQPTTLQDGSGGSGVSGDSITGQCVPPQPVRSVIVTCTPCHGQSGSLPRLANATDFQAKSPDGGTYGGRSLARMKDAGSPMPPEGLLSASAVSIFEDWIDGGYPLVCPTSSSTATSTSGGDAMAGGGTGIIGP